MEESKRSAAPVKKLETAERRMVAKVVSMSRVLHDWNAVRVFHFFFLKHALAFAQLSCMFFFLRFFFFHSSGADKKGGARHLHPLFFKPPTPSSTTHPPLSPPTQHKKQVHHGKELPYRRIRLWSGQPGLRQEGPGCPASSPRPGPEEWSQPRAPHRRVCWRRQGRQEPAQQERCPWRTVKGREHLILVWFSFKIKPSCTYFISSFGCTNASFVFRRIWMYAWVKKREKIRVAMHGLIC